MKRNRYFLRYLNGKWSKQERLVLVGSRKQKIFDKVLSFCFKDYLKSEKIIFVEINKKDRYNKGLILLSKNLLNNHNKLYVLIYFVVKNLVKITKVSRKLNLTHKEYIYIVNKKIMVSIVGIVNANGKYLALKISSYIKLK